MTTKTDKIRQLNDAFRSNFIGGEVIVTRGVADLGLLEQVDVYRLVRGFNAFTPDNDPHGEHDFGAFMYRGARYNWKIDYYDANPNSQYGSQDPSNPAVTKRVLTIMQADEY